MALTDTRLRVFTFPQQWDGSRVSVRVLVAPFGNPLLPLDPGLKAFARARLALSAHLVPGLDRLPRPADVSERILLGTATPADLEQVYVKVADHFAVDPSAPAAYVPPQKTAFLKMLMPSYREVSGFAEPRTEFAVSDDRYICALVEGARPAKRPPKPVPPPKWDALIAMAIRQPVLAARLGLLYVGSVQPLDPAFYEDGGWLYVTLDATSDYFGAGPPDFLKLYGARIPALQAGVPAPVFAPVLFPVGPVPPPGSFDEILREADEYSDGFARLVHTFQPDRADYLNLSRQDERRPRPYQETGLKLGWDDEQVVIWLNRQISEDPRNGSPTARDTPLGVRGFRVDVRDAEGPGPWHSLVRMQGPIEVGGLGLGTFSGEMAIEPTPSQLQGQRDGEYWLAPYFTQWTGSSLIAADAMAFKAANRPAGPRALMPVFERSVPLRYGRTYQFRVRLTDITGGGPGPDAAGEPPSAVGSCRFRRFVPPDAPELIGPVPNDDGSITYSVRRPLLGYPALVYTPLPGAEALLLADVPAAAVTGRPAGYPDPDVTRVRIDVAVGSLELDPDNLPGPEPLRRLYSTVRELDADPDALLPITLQFEDTPDLAVFAVPAPAGPLVLPTARTIEITVTSIARRDPGMPPGIADPAAAEIIDADLIDRDGPGLVYFGKHAARVGARRVIRERREAVEEPALFLDIPGVPLQGIFLQPSPAQDAPLRDRNAAAGARDEAPDGAIQRLARQLRLEYRGLTLSGQAGRRLAFGASAAVRHVLSPDHATITFASETEITSQWLVAVPLRIARDWTWDAVTDVGFEVFRSIDGRPPELAGVISPRRTLSSTAVASGVAPIRHVTDLLFFDEIDPKPAPGELPAPIEATYSVVPQFRHAPILAPSWTGALRLPIAARPTQVPRIASAGIALSPYERDETYARTFARRRMLWIEFVEPVANPRDAYFARVTMHVADPMLVDAEPDRPPGPLEPPLGIDREAIRAVIPDQPEDASGLDAMQRLIPAAGDGPIRHFLLPLPPALSEASAELFGFFVYEFRVGHAEDWSTAQARFGLPLRLTGVQHPAPHLPCSISRTAEHIRVTAPFALPAADGQNLRAEPPHSALWALLYVQVRLADASDWRNILAGRARLEYPEEAVRGRRGSEPHGVGYLDQDQIDAWLASFGLPLNSPLSVLAVELLPEPGSPYRDPLGEDLGNVRVLRTSPLTPVPAICLDG